MTTDSRPTAARKQTRTTKAKQDAAFDVGLAITDDDGTRLQVRLRHVKGVHDAALVAAVGLDFMGLHDALNKRKGLDLLAALLWFCRLVNGRDSESYEEILNRFGYEDVLALDPGDPKPEDDSPEA